MVLDLTGEEAANWMKEEAEPLKYSERYSEEEIMEGAVENGIMTYGASIAKTVEEHLDY